MRFGKKPSDETQLTILEKIIVDIVTQRQGCKLMDLIVEITNIIGNETRSNVDLKDYSKFLEISEFEALATHDKVNTLLDTITGLISKNKLIGLHYKLGVGNYHEKMFILPKGSSFKYLNKKELSSNE